MENKEEAKVNENIIEIPDDKLEKVTGGDMSRIKEEQKGNPED